MRIRGGGKGNPRRDARPGFAPANRQRRTVRQRPAGAVKPGVSVRSVSKVISSANSSSATACRITRQRISRFDRRGSPPPRTRPNMPANSTPSVASISRPTRTDRNVLIAVNIGAPVPELHPHRRPAVSTAAKAIDRRPRCGRTPHEALCLLRPAGWQACVAGVRSGAAPGSCRRRASAAPGAHADRRAAPSAGAKPAAPAAGAAAAGCAGRRDHAGAGAQTLEPDDDARSGPLSRRRSRRSCKAGRRRPASHRAGGGAAPTKPVTRGAARHRRRSAARDTARGRPSGSVDARLGARAWTALLGASKRRRTSGSGRGDDRRTIPGSSTACRMRCWRLAVVFGRGAAAEFLVRRRPPASDAPAARAGRRASTLRRNARRFPTDAPDAPRRTTTSPTAADDRGWPERPRRAGHRAGAAAPTAWTLLRRLPLAARPAAAGSAAGAGVPASPAICC